MANQNHHYYQLAVNLLPRVVDRLVQRGEIAPPEANAILQLNGSPQFHQFVDFMIQNFPTLNGEQQLEQQLYYRFVQPIYNDMRRRAGAGYGAPPPPGYGGGYGGGGYGGYGGGGYPPPPMERGSSWYGGNRVMTPPGPAGYRRGPSGGYMQPQPPPPPRREQRRQEQKKAPERPPWKIPEIIPNSKINVTLDNNAAFAIERFVGFDGAGITNAFVIDNRPRFVTDFDAIAAYRGMLETMNDERMFLTVCYNKMHVIRADRNAFKNLVKAVSGAVSNISPDNVKDRVRMIMNISKDHMADAKEAYEKLVVDEFNYHVRCGELTDSDHPAFTVTISNLQALYNLLAGDISKETRDALHAIKNFDERLATVASRVVDTVVLNADKRILDPIVDKTIMDIYGRAIPPVWKNERENTWENTANFFAKYLASTKTVNGTQPQVAVVAGQQLHTKLTLADRTFTVFLVPRIITWNNTSVRDIVNVNEDGSITTSVFGSDKSVRAVDNDITYFINTVFKRTGESKLTAFSVIPHSVICESAGTMTRLNYGVTSDGCMYVGPGSF